MRGPNENPQCKNPSFLTKWWDLQDLSKKKSFWIWFICTLEGCVLLLTFFVEKMQLWNTLRTLCQAHWSVNNFCLNWKVCLSWWVVFLLRTFYGFKQFCWLCHHDIVLPWDLNYTTFRKKEKLSKCWSGHISSSLWSNVSKVTSL